MTADKRPPTADELPDGWVWTTLEKVAGIGAEQILPLDYPERQFNYLALENISQGTGEIVSFAPTLGAEIKSNKFKFTPEHVLYGKLRPYLRKAVAPDFNGVSATDLLPLKPAAGSLDRHFLVWWLLSPQILEYVVKRQTGVKMPRLRSRDLKQMPVPLPPLSEQQRIIAKIEALFRQSRRGREALNGVPDLLNKFRQAVLAAAFRGALTQRDPADEPASVLLERTRAERCRKWEEDLRAQGKDPSRYKYKEPEPPDTSELSALPQEWVWTKLGCLFTVKIGGTPARKVPEYWNGDIPWVSSGEVAFCRINATCEYITAEGLAKSSAKLNPPGTVLLAMIGEGKTRGQSAILDVAAANNQNVAAILCSETPTLPEWVFWWLKARYQETRSGGSGGAQPALNASRVKELTIPLAPLAEQHHIVTRIEALFAQADILETQVAATRRRLEQVDQAILARAFRGELVSQDPNDEPASALLE